MEEKKTVELNLGFMRLFYKRSLLVCKYTETYKSFSNNNSVVSPVEFNKYDFGLERMQIYKMEYI